jgi:tRNA (mo5U34)-methyltransferase
MTKEEVKIVLSGVNQCFHQLKFDEDLYAPGVTLHPHLMEAVKFNHIPDPRGKTVLDIGAWDGFYSFYCEENGAQQVTAIDHHVWERSNLGTDDIDPSLPGKRVFDLYHRFKNSNVKSVYKNFLEWHCDEPFDIVLFFGVLYHINNPYLAMQKVFEFTKPNGVAVINTHAIKTPGNEHLSLFEFYPFAELNHDRTNWFSVNEKALIDLCRSVGFRNVIVKNQLFHYAFKGNNYYRLIVHAEK